MTPQRFNILLVDDERASARLFEMALSEVAPGAKLYWVGTGEEAVEALERRDRFVDLTGIDIVVLDLNMTPVDGFQVLQRIRAHDDSNLANKPLIVMSSSRDPGDIKRAYDCGATSYIVKPVTVEATNNVVAALTKYWLDVVSLPPE